LATGNNSAVELSVLNSGISEYKATAEDLKSNDNYQRRNHKQKIPCYTEDKMQLLEKDCNRYW
jgi:hypothetical protein